MATIEIAVSGPNFADDRAFADKIMKELSQVPSLRDLQYGQSLDYPTIQVDVDREKAGLDADAAVDRTAGDRTGPT